MVDQCCKSCDKTPIDFKVIQEGSRKFLITNDGYKFMYTYEITVRKCLICEVRKPKMFSFININKRFVFIDEFGDVWHGNKCPDCSSHVIKTKKIKTKVFEFPVLKSIIPNESKIYIGKNGKYLIPEREKIREYQRSKRKNDLNYRLACSLRSRLSICLRTHIKTKVGSAIKDLGCSMDELIRYLESKFQPGMNWDNYGLGVGNWNIDHTYPLSKVNLSNRDEFLKASHYTNLTPMWDRDNKSKSNKI